MKNRFIAFGLIILLTLQVFGCVTTEDEDFELSESTDPEPYEADEFPDWLQTMRRAEIVFAGSIPFTLLASTIGYSLVSVFQSGGTSITDFTSSSSMTDDDRLIILSVSGGLSALIAIADLIIGIAEEDSNDG